MKLVKVFRDPAIGFPWMGEHGKTVRVLRLRKRGFGIWSDRDGFRTLNVGIWWVYRIDVMGHCP